MAEPTLDYRIWQYGTQWIWQLMDGKQVLASGTAESSHAARTAAFCFCLDLQRNQSEDSSLG